MMNQRAIIIDNDDSFTHNLRHLIASVTGTSPDLVPYAELSRLDAGKYDLIIISPGPGTPSDYPAYSKLLSLMKPTIGVCLGMQIMNEFFGGTTVRSESPIHGQSKAISFQGVRQSVARYHSLKIGELGSGLIVEATDELDIPMAIRHESAPMIGFQFHPESFLTNNGTSYIKYALEAVNTVTV